MRKLFLATLVFLTGAGFTPSASATALPRVVLPAGVQLHMRPVVRPANIGIPNDGAGWTRSITWSTWGEQQAVGHGWGYFHTCKPNCDQGFAYWEPVTVTYARPRPTPFGVLFTRLSMTWCMVQDCRHRGYLKGVATAPSGPRPYSRLSSWALAVLVGPRGAL